MADMAPMTVYRKKATPGFEAGGRPKIKTLAQRVAKPQPKKAPTAASRTIGGKALTSAIASMVMGGVSKMGNS